MVDASLLEKLTGSFNLSELVSVILVTSLIKDSQNVIDFKLTLKLNL